MIVQPSSTVSIYSGVKIADGEQIAFSSRTTQKAYFAKHLVSNRVQCTYIRRSGTIKMDWPTNQVSQCNYISFTNPAYENIEFYARIVDYNYINQNTTEISYNIDYFQTFMFTMEYDKCGIIRQHLSQQGKTEADAQPWKMTENTTELFTAEDLPVAPDILDRPVRFENGEGNTFIEGAETNHNCLVMQIAMFDGDLIDTYQDFLNYFTCVISPDGQMVHTSSDFAYFFPDYPTDGYYGYLPRAYLLGVISDFDDSVTLPVQGMYNWLEFQGLTSSVLGVYQMGLEDVYDMFNDLLRNTQGVTAIAMDFPDKSKWVNKKLCLYPYSYLRVKNLMGLEKEYKWELFTQGQTTVDPPQALFTTRIISDSSPYRSVIPIGYGESIFQSGADGADELENFGERLDSAPAVQLPYATDSYLTFLSTKYQAAAAQQTTVQQAVQAFNASDWGAGISVAGTLIDGVMNLIGGIVSGGGYLNEKPVGPAGVALARPSTGGIVGTIASNADAGMAYNALFGGEGQPGYRASDVPTGTESFGPWSEARQAFIASNYHPSTVDGGIAFHGMDKGYTPTTMFFISQQLKPQIMKKYDEYFSLFGYNSRRYDMPWVCYFMKGSSDPAKLPAWDTTFGDGQVYIKTQNMHVFGVPEVATRQVEAMFNSGMFVKNGDTM